MSLCLEKCKKTGEDASFLSSSPAIFDAIAYQFNFSLNKKALI